jgi:uncharacterized protein (TIGR02453 family)
VFLAKKEAASKNKIPLYPQKIFSMGTTIKKETLQFLKDLSAHNDREWFNKNKDKFVSANENFMEITQALITTVAAFDKAVVGLQAKDCVFRIYRDVRFSKDKSPYKTFFGAHLMGREKGCGVAGYYFHMEPGKSFLAGGVHMTEPQNLKAIREEISEKGKTFLKIINENSFKNNFKIEGEKLSKVPQGFDKEDPMAEYLKYKELMIHHHVKDKEIVASDFVSYCSKVFKAMVPFNKFVNDPVMALK